MQVAWTEVSFGKRIPSLVLSRNLCHCCGYNVFDNVNLHDYLCLFLGVNQYL